ncbi:MULTISPECIES: hypothetical protein [unclassified Inquilinus]|uniref:hypothetical protein n=1 Tax=unclassified Inquilinus TaxID=2645927 RepID=UPI003F92537A
MTASNLTPKGSGRRAGFPPLDRVIALVQILGGLVGLGVMAPQIYRDAPAIIALTQGLVLGAAALLFLLCILAGGLLWRRRPIGYVLSILVQVLQIPIIYTGDLIYHFHMVARLVVTLSASTAAASTTPAYGIGLDPFQGLLSLGLYLDTGLPGAIIGVNLLPVILCVILEYSRRQNW